MIICDDENSVFAARNWDKKLALKFADFPAELKKDVSIWNSIVITKEFPCCVKVGFLVGAFVLDTDGTWTGPSSFKVGFNVGVFVLDIDGTLTGPASFKVGLRVKALVVNIVGLVIGPASFKVGF